MTYKEFLEYLENNFDGYEVFMEKAAAYQQLKNQKRPAKSRWNDGKVYKAANEMWKKAMQPLYDNLRREVKSGIDYKWIEYIEQHEVLENLRDAMVDISFNEASI
ncbi:hypothetical protein AALH30_24540 [Blautia pseudococcoides]|uniref:hypothetical protein n=1 Tax=Blautia pseudococcoides TaxID=1796616 RepID=UPI00351886E8